MKIVIMSKITTEIVKSTIKRYREALNLIKEYALLEENYTIFTKAVNMITELNAGHYYEDKYIKAFIYF